MLFQKVLFRPSCTNFRLLCCRRLSAPRGFHSTASFSALSRSIRAHDPYQDPLKVTNVFDLKCAAPPYTIDDFETWAFGYWLVFRNLEDLNATWCALREELVSGRLQRGAVGATCSTLRYDPTKHRAGPHVTGRIRVMTQEDAMLEVGEQLIRLPEVRHDIKYKTMEASNDGVFAHTVQGNRHQHHHQHQHQRVTMTSLYWNEGSPSTTLRGEPSASKHRAFYNYHASADKWRLHIVEGSSFLEVPHGCWIVPFEYRNFDLTHLWHKLKFLVEGGRIRCVRMECVAPETRLERPSVQVFTTVEQREEVGEQIMAVVKRSINYVLDGHCLKWKRPSAAAINSGDNVDESTVKDFT